MTLFLLAFLAALDARYPGWRLAPVAPQIGQWFRQDRFPYLPNLVNADFDGDHETDYAVSLIYRGREKVAALMSRNGKYELHELADDQPDPFTFLVLYKKGDKDVDYESGKPFRYANDSLGVLYSKRTAMTFRWREGKFERRAAPGDEEAEALR